MSVRDGTVSPSFGYIVAPLFISEHMLIMVFSAGLVFGFTALAAVLFGRRLARRSRMLAILSCAAVVPLLLVLAAVVSLMTAPGGPPPNDAPAMVFVILIRLAALSSVVSLPASALLIPRTD